MCQITRAQLREMISQPHQGMQIRFKCLRLTTTIASQKCHHVHQFKIRKVGISFLAKVVGHLLPACPSPRINSRSEEQQPSTKTTILNTL